MEREFLWLILKARLLFWTFGRPGVGHVLPLSPAMQLAVDRFADDNDVEFLFIHTWENVADPLTDAKDFLSKRNYRFDLYMDVKDPVTKVPPAVTAFRITGIPAKFVIDPQGNIRFKVEGFHGTAEAAAEELVQMVEMVRKGE